MGQRLGSGEKHCILQMNMLVEILFQIEQAGEERPVGVTGIRWRVKAVSQQTQARQGFPGIVMFMLHARDGILQRSKGGLSLAERGDGREENLFLFENVLRKFLLQGEEHIEHFQKRRGVASVDLGDAGRHGAQAGQFAAQEFVMRFDDVRGEVRERQIGGVFRRGGLIGEFRFELFHDTFGGDILAGAGVTQGQAALTAEIDAEILEDAGTPGTFGDKFADRAFQQRSSRR